LSWEKVKSDYEEYRELLAIFTSIGKKVNRKRNIILTLGTLDHFSHFKLIVPGLSPGK